MAGKLYTVHVRYTDMPLTIIVDPAAATPAYRQIVDQLRHYIVDGMLAPGEVLPGVRRLAMDLGVHFNTVAEAYRTLAQEGWLEVSQGKAVRVVSQAPAPEQSEELQQGFRQRLRMLISEMRGSGIPVEMISEELRLAAERMKS